MINSSWPMRPLGELFEIGAGKTMSAAAREGTDKTPFLRTSNVLWDEIDLTTVDEMAIPAVELDGKLLRAGDLLVCEGGEIGRAAIWNGEIPRISFQNHVHRLRPLGDDIETRFYVYFLQCGFTQLGIFEGAGNKTTIPNLSRSRLAALEVPHPSIADQRMIAIALKRVRDAQKLHDRIVRRIDELKARVTQSLFMRGLRSEKLQETVLGPLPGSWRLIPLGSIGKIGSGTTPDRTDTRYWAGGTVPWITSGRMYDREITTASEHLTLEGVKEARLPLLKPGAVLIAIVGQGKTLGHCAILRVEATISRHVGYVQPDTTLILPEYLRAYLETRYERLRQLASGNGSTRAALTGAILREIPVPVPPTLDEQADIAGVVDSIDRKRRLHKRKAVILEELFTALLHKLMTGQVRVGDLDMSAIADGSLAEMAS